MRKPATALAVVIALCGGSDSQAQTQLESKIVFAGLGGSVQTGYQQCVIDRFQKKFNVRVEYVAGQTAENMARIIAQRANPTIDVYLATDADQFRGAQQGLFEEVSVKDIPNIAKVSHLLKDKFGVPVDFTMAGLGYNTRVFSEKGWVPPTSWKDLWDPKFKGRVTIYTASITFGIGLLELIASLNGGSAANLDPGFAKILELKPNLYTIATAQAQVDQGLNANSVWLSVNTSQRVMLAKQQGIPVEFVQPEEGVMRTYRYVDLVKGAPNPKAARAFMNWMLEDEAQACIPDTVGVSPVLSTVAVPPNLANYYLPSRAPHNTNWQSLLSQFSKVVARWSEQVEAK